MSVTTAVVVVVAIAASTVLGALGKVDGPAALGAIAAAVAAGIGHSVAELRAGKGSP